MQGRRKGRTSLSLSLSPSLCLFKKFPLLPPWLSSLPCERKRASHRRNAVTSSLSLSLSLSLSGFPLPQKPRSSRRPSPFLSRIEKSETLNSNTPPLSSSRPKFFSLSQAPAMASLCVVRVCFLLGLAGIFVGTILFGQLNYPSCWIGAGIFGGSTCVCALCWLSYQCEQKNIRQRVAEATSRGEAAAAGDPKGVRPDGSGEDVAAGDAAAPGHGSQQSEDALAHPQLPHCFV